MYKRLINNKISNKLTFKYSYTYNGSRLDFTNNFNRIILIDKLYWNKYVYRL